LKKIVSINVPTWNYLEFSLLIETNRIEYVRSSRIRTFLIFWSFFEFSFGFGRTVFSNEKKIKFQSMEIIQENRQFIQKLFYKNDRKHVCIVRKFNLYNYQKYSFWKQKVSIKIDFIRKFFKFNWENMIIFLYFYIRYTN